MAPHIMYTGPLKQYEPGQTGPCQPTEFQHIGALILDTAGLSILWQETVMELYFHSASVDL